MANRYFKQPTYAFEQDLVTIYGRFVLGATGAVTAGTVKGGGVLSVVRNGTGDYTITLQDKFSKVMEVTANFVSATGNSGIAAVEPYNATPANYQSGFQTNKAVSVKTLDFAGAAANPVSGAYCYFKLVVKNTSVDPFGY